MCDCFYIFNRELNIAYTFEFTAHQVNEGQTIPATEIILKDPDGILNAMAEAFQQAGILPQSAVDAELKATKYHLEDMRKINGC